MFEILFVSSTTSSGARVTRSEFIDIVRTRKSSDWLQAELQLQLQFADNIENITWLRGNMKFITSVNKIYHE